MANRAGEYELKGDLEDLKGRKGVSISDKYPTKDQARRAIVAGILKKAGKWKKSPGRPKENVDLDANAMIEAYLDGHDPEDILEVAANINEYIDEDDE